MCWSIDLDAVEEVRKVGNCRGNVCPKSKSMRSVGPNTVGLTPSCTGCLDGLDAELDVSGDGPIVNVEEGGGVVLGAAPRELLDRLSACSSSSAKRCSAFAVLSAALATSISASCAEDEP